MVLKLRDSRVSMRELKREDCLDFGGSAAVRTGIDSVVADVNWSDPTWGIVTIDGSAIEFAIGGDAPDDRTSFAIHVHGPGDPIPTIVALCRANGWTAIDLQLGQFIDLDNPSREGWNRFNAALDRLKRTME